MKFFKKDLFPILKNTFVILIVCLLFLYTFLYLGLPYFLNKKDYSKVITENVKKQTGLILLIKDYKLSVSPKLEINLTAQKLQLFYPDKKQILDIKKAELDISTLNLLRKELKLNKVKADEVQLSTKLLKNGKTTFQEYLEKNIKKTNSEIIFSKTLPKIKINKYVIKVKDEESGQKFKLSGENFRITQNIDFRYLNFETKGNLYCFNKKFVNYDLKLAVPKVIFNEVNNVLFDISLDNLYKQNFYANVVSDLKIHTKNNQFDYLSGKIDIDNFTTKIGAITLPPSIFHINLDKGRAVVSSKFYTNADEVSDINADIKITKPYDAYIKCKCPKADIANLQKLSISLLELLKIKNNLSEFKTSGVISADFSVKTDLKKIQSNGSLKIKNAQISHKSIPLKITGINALIDFSNNSVKIKQSDILVNNQPVKINGHINPDATGDILVSAKSLDINHIMNAFPILKPEKNLTVTSGKLSFKASLKGKLVEASPQIDAVVDDFSLLLKTQQIKIAVKEILINLKTNAKSTKDSFNGIVKLKNLTCYSKEIPNSSNTLLSDEITTAFDNKDITINPSRLTTGNAKITLSGAVKNYMNSPQTHIILSGTADTGLLKSLAEKKDIVVYNKGYIPVRAEFKSNEKEIIADIKLLANPSNYITPLNVNSFLQINTLTHILLKTNGKVLNIDDFSIYYAPNVNGLVKDINLMKLKRALFVRGKVVQPFDKTPQFENIKIQTPEPLNISIPEIKNAKANINADLLLNGNAKNPILNGLLNITNLEIPQLFVKAQNALITLNKNNINAKIDSLKIKNMDLSIETSTSSDFLLTNKINHLRLNASYLDMDYLMSLMPLLPDWAQSKYSDGIEFPFIISSGRLNIKSFKMGDLKAQNINADISSQKNIFYIKNMLADAYSGKTGGKITYNFPYSTIQAEIQGRGLDANSAAKDMMPTEQQLSGRLNFDASVSMIGTTKEQQMKTLKGRADIVIQHGHLGTLGRFEHFLYAQNLLSQRLIYASLNSAKQAISPKDTGRFTYLKGMLKFNNGYVYLNPVVTSGPQMSMYITGNLNLLNNEADLQILGRVSSEVSSSLGLLGTMTIKDFLDEHTKYAQSIANLFNFCNSELPELDISKIPELNPNLRYQTKNFRVLISGDTESVKAVKSFTWVNPIGTKQKALKEKVQEAINKALPSTNSTTHQTIQNPSYYEATPQQPVIQSRPMQPVIKPQNQPAEFLDNIPDNFK